MGPAAPDAAGQATSTTARSRLRARRALKLGRGWVTRPILGVGCANFVVLKRVILVNLSHLVSTNVRAQDVVGSAASVG